MGRYYKTETFVYTKAFMDVILTAYKTDPAAPLAPTLKIRLGQDEAFVPTVNTTLAAANAQVATFTDYAEAALTLTGPVNLGDVIQGMLASATWLMTTDPVAVQNTIWNYYLYSGTLLVGAEKFAGGLSIPMATVGDFMQIDVQLPQLGIVDAS